MERIFVGSTGLRAGWRVAIFALVAAAFGTLVSLGLTALVRAATHGRGAHAGAAVDAPIGETILALAAFVATAVMARVERKTLWSYGLRDGRKLRTFAIGLASGLVLMSLETGVLLATGHLQLAFSGAGAASALGFALLWGYVFVLTGFAEEMLFRGYPLVALTRGIGFWPAAILLSVVFGALHGVNGGEALIGEVSAGAIALVLCFAIRRTGSLWWAIGFHAGWDWTESYLWGARDSGFVTPGALFVSTPSGAPLLSGGNVGPEGSLFVAIPIALAALAIVATTRTVTTRMSAGMFEV